MAASQIYKEVSKDGESTAALPRSRLAMHKTRFPGLFFLGVIILLYALLSFYQIHLPGLHYDEAFEAVPALQLWQGQPVTSFRNNGLLVAGRLWPLMTQDYIGALNTYAVIPFIALLGPTPAALRVMAVLTGAGTLYLAYLLGQQLSGRQWVGTATALLLAVDPTFVFWNRQGIFVTAITATLGLAAALCWLRRLRNGSILWTAAGAFLFALGVYAKLLFIWLIIALLGAALLLNLAESRKQPQEFLARWKTDLFVAVPVFAAACWPLLVYNFQTGGTWLNLSQNAATSYYGVNNLAVGSNLLERLSQFMGILNGSHLWYLGQIISNPVPALMFVLVLAGVIFKLFFTRLDGPARVALFPFVVIGLVILASIGTISALWITHFALLMPWPSLAITLGMWFISQRWEMSGQRLNYKALSAASLSQLSRFGVGVVLGLLVISNLIAVLSYHRALTESGGLSGHSDAIYKLSDWLAERSTQPVVAMDWGLAAAVTFLTGGRVTPTEVFGYDWEASAELTPRLQYFIAEPATLYLWRAPDEIIFDRSPQFKVLYRPLKLEETIEAAFYERSGRPLLGVTRLVPLGSAANPPQ